jgi:putative transposase
MSRVITSLLRLLDGCLDVLSARFARWTKPFRTSLPLSTLTNLGRSKSELIAENALLRQQLIVLRRQVKQPTFTRTDRILLVLLARLVRTWQQTLLIVQPDTLLRGPRELFRLYWKRRSKALARKPKVAAQTIALIRQMAKDNRLWARYPAQYALFESMQKRVSREIPVVILRQLSEPSLAHEKPSTELRTLCSASAYGASIRSCSRSLEAPAYLCLP